jgi:hypothetical protein
VALSRRIGCTPKDRSKPAGHAQPARCFGLSKLFGMSSLQRRFGGVDDAAKEQTVGVGGVRPSSSKRPASREDRYATES